MYTTRCPRRLSSSSHPLLDGASVEHSHPINLQRTEELLRLSGRARFRINRLQPAEIAVPLPQFAGEVAQLRGAVAVACEQLISGPYHSIWEKSRSSLLICGLACSVAVVRPVVARSRAGPAQPLSLGLSRLQARRSRQNSQPLLQQHVGRGAGPFGFVPRTGQSRERLSDGTF